MHRTIFKNCRQTPFRNLLIRPVCYHSVVNQFQLFKTVPNVLCVARCCQIRISVKHILIRGCRCRRHFDVLKQTQILKSYSMRTLYIQSRSVFPRHFSRVRMLCTNVIYFIFSLSLMKNYSAYVYMNFTINKLFVMYTSSPFINDI